MDISIVHLSDLHFKNDVENRHRIDRLITDLKRLGDRGPIITAFTGDLVQAGDDNTYDVLFDLLIGPLINMGHEIAIVPGNHDIQRSIVNEEVQDKFLADSGSSYLFHADSQVLEPYANGFDDPLQKFIGFQDLFGPYEARSYWGFLKTVGSVSLVGLNSTWLSRQRKSGDSDRGKLRIEPHILDQLTSVLPEDTLKVALLHHPLDWLEDVTRDAVTKLLTSQMDIALFGHVHAKDISNLAHEQSDCLFLQSPPLRANWSKGTNGYSIINCDTKAKRYEIEYRSYSKPRRQFVVGEDFAAGGRSFPRPVDAAYFKSNPSLQGLEQRFVDGDPPDFTDWYRTNIRAKTKSLPQFIVPKATRVLTDEEERWQEPSIAINDIILGSDRDQFFVAPPDTGLTTAAFLAFKELASSFSKHRKIPVYFDASSYKINKASLQREANRTNLINYTASEIVQLADGGQLVFVIDGLSLADVGQFNLFRDTARRFFDGCRFICFVNTEKRGFTVPDENDLDLFISRDEVFEFSQLEVADIREMVALSREINEADTIDVVVDQVVDTFRQMDEPIFASSVAVVVETLAQDPDFRPLNKSRLLERYVECLLGRFDVEDVREGTFSSSDKIDFLSYIARLLLESDDVAFSETNWEEMCQSYQDQYLIELPKDLLDEFIDKGLLTIHNGRITFRADYLFSFFVARQMKRDLAFASQLTDENGVFTFHREIVFYGELEGTDVGTVLNHVYVVISEVEEMLLEAYSRQGVDLTTEWEIACSERVLEEPGEVGLNSAAELLADAKPSQEQADRMSDNELSRVTRRRGISRRIAVKEAEAKLLLLMKLYALLIKNALQLPAEDKLRHLAKLYQSGEVWTGMLCALRGEISKKPLVLAGGIKFINLSAAFDPERAARDFKYDAPNSISRVLSEAVRNPQLSVALRKVLPGLDDLGRLFVRDALLEIPGKDNRNSYTQSLLSEGNIDLATCSLRTLRSRFLASGRNKEVRGHLEEIVKTIEKASKSSYGIDFDKLRKARLVRDMKETANEARKRE